MSERINLEKTLPGVSENTFKVLKHISSYPELASYFLVGGTALAIRIQSRLSEDLDFFYYNHYPGKKLPLPKINTILDKLKNDSNAFEVVSGDLKFDVTCIVDGIKIDFHSEHQFHFPKQFDLINNIKLPDEFSLVGMKVIALGLREAWRDVYDLFSLQKLYDCSSFWKSYSTIISSFYAGSKKNRAGLFMKTMSKLEDKEFLTKLIESDNILHLEPKYNVTPDLVISNFHKFTKELGEEFKKQFSSS